MGALNDWRSRPRKPRPDLVTRNAASAVHGGARLERSPTYRSWQSMKDRILASESKDFANYGGRGLDMDPRWHAYIDFYADMGERPEGTTLDRRNNARGYWPDNCRWATVVEQNNNRRSSRLVEHDGRIQTVAQWARELGTSRQVIRYRLEAGWSPAQAFTTTPNPANRRST